MKLKYIVYICVLLEELKLTQSKLKRKILVPINNNEISILIKNIMDNCFFKKNVLAIMDNDNKSIFQITNSFSNIPITLLAFDQINIPQQQKRFFKVYILNEINFQRKNVPASSVIIEISSPQTNFTRILKYMYESVWWNNEARFLVINRNNENGCQMAHKILSELWSFNILSALYLCSIMNNKLFLYTFNPYTYVSPKFWHISKQTISNAYWTLFEHQLQNDDQLFYQSTLICDDWYFDKTLNLQAFNLRTITNYNKLHVYFEEQKVGYARYKGLIGSLIGTLLSHINATFTMQIVQNIGSLDKNDKPYGTLKNVLLGTADVLMYTFLLRDYWTYQVYPFNFDGIKIVSMRHESPKYIFQLAFSFNVKFWVIFILSSTVSILALKYILKTPINMAIFNFIKMFTGGSIVTLPDNSLKRVIFMIVAILTLVMSTYAYSYLSAMNITLQSEKTIDSFEDLLKRNIIVYGYSTHRDMIRKFTNLDFIALENMELCIARISKKEDVACLIPVTFLGLEINDTSIVHISKQTYFERGETFTCKENFPLLYRFNIILSYLKQGGFIQLFYERERKLPIIIKRKRYNKPSRIKIVQLSFCFLILILGEILSVFIFLIEYIINAISIHYSYIRT